MPVRMRRLLCRLQQPPHRTLRLNSSAGAPANGNSVTEGIVRRKYERRLSRNVSRACDLRPDSPIFHFDIASEYAAQNSFLPPVAAGREFAVSRKARHLCACPGAARRAVISFSRTEDKIAAVIGWIVRRSDQFNVIDLGPICPGNEVCNQSLAHLPRKRGQLFNVRGKKRERVILDEKKPVSAPGYVSVNSTEPWNHKRNSRAVTIRIHIAYSHASVVAQRHL